MSNSLLEYFEALERLKAGAPLRVPKGARINNDTVSVEAGRGKGSIKKSRPKFAELIVAIDAAAAHQVEVSDSSVEQARLHKAKKSAKDYHKELDACLAREVSLVREVYNLKKELARLTGGNVLPIRQATTPGAD